MSQDYRDRALRGLTNETGVYALVDLDAVPIYIGQSIDGIRSRVRRHLTSARSDIIANRQIDVWEVAEVWAWPAQGPEAINALEAALFAKFDGQSPLMNGSIPVSAVQVQPAQPVQTLAVMDAAERDRRKEPAVRLPRQIEHYQRLVDYILVVKDAPHLRRSVDAHYARLSRYHRGFLHQDIVPIGSEDKADTP